MTQPLYSHEAGRRDGRRGAPALGRRGFPIPVLLGILPLQSARHAEFLHNEVPGITIPPEARAAMAAAGDRGAEVGLELALRLLDDARELVARHVPHAELRSLRAGSRARPTDPRPPAGRLSRTMRRTKSPTRGWTKGRSGTALAAPLGFLAAIGLLGVLALPAVAAGPPFPEPVEGERVYDTASILVPRGHQPGRPDHSPDRGPDSGPGRGVLTGRRRGRYRRRGPRPGEGAGGAMGRRPERLQRRRGRPVRYRAQRRPRPGCDRRRGPASGRPTSTTARRSGSSTRR